MAMALTEFEQQRHKLMQLKIKSASTVTNLKRGKAPLLISG